MNLNKIQEKKKSGVYIYVIGYEISSGTSMGNVTVLVDGLPAFFSKGEAEMYVRAADLDNPVIHQLPMVRVVDTGKAGGNGEVRGI